MTTQNKKELVQDVIDNFAKEKRRIESITVVLKWLKDNIDDDPAADKRAVRSIKSIEETSKSCFEISNDLLDSITK